jgi:hypothetical protein
MIGLNAYFLQSSALENVTTLFAVAARGTATATSRDDAVPAAVKDIVATATSPTVRRTVSALAGAVSPLVSGAVLDLGPKAEADEDGTLPPGWTKYGSPGVRGWETIEEIDDPDVKAMFEESERITRLLRETEAEFGFYSVEYQTLSWRWESDRKAALAEVAPVLEKYGRDSVEYREAAIRATRDWGLGDLGLAKRDYERAKDMLANPTFNRLLWSYFDAEGVLQQGTELTHYTQEQLAAAQKLVDDYPQTMADMVKRVEKSIRRAYGLTGQVMVQDANGEYQWGAFRAYNDYTGAPAYTLSADGIVTGYGNSGEVLATNQINGLWG